MWLLAQLHLYHRALPSFEYSAPISFLSLVFSTLSALSIPQAVHSTCACYNSTLRIQRSIPFDLVDPSDLFLTLMGVASFNLIIIFTCSLYVSSITIFMIMRGKEPQGPFTDFRSIVEKNRVPTIDSMVSYIRGRGYASFLVRLFSLQISMQNWRPPSLGLWRGI